MFVSVRVILPHGPLFLSLSLSLALARAHTHTHTRVRFIFYAIQVGARVYLHVEKMFDQEAAAAAAYIYTIVARIARRFYILYLRLRYVATVLLLLYTHIIYDPFLHIRALSDFGEKCIMIFFFASSLDSQVSAAAAAASSSFFSAFARTRGRAHLKYIQYPSVRAVNSK